MNLAMEDRRPPNAYNLPGGGGGNLSATIHISPGQDQLSEDPINCYCDIPGIQVEKILHANFFSVLHLAYKRFADRLLLK